MMSMLNQAAVEALCSATYLENYLDCMENLPDDLQRVVSQLRELDGQANEIIKDMAHQKELYSKQDDGGQKKRALIQIQRGLIRTQEIGDEKLQMVSSIVEFIENRTRQLEQDLENLDPGTAHPISRYNEEERVVKPTTSTSNTHVAPKVTKPQETEKSESTKNKRQRRQRTAAETKQEEEKKEEEEKPKKKKKRKQKKEKGGEKSPIDPPIDPDEPTYCLCEQVSYGEMIGCDYDGCAIEWYHFNCVGLTNKPKGKWYCPKCRGDKANLLRHDLAEALKKNK